jgi:type I restriction-modification system DNA methylase subunit
MPAPSAITALVERFQDNRDSYTAQGYNEAQLRQEFLNPFFAALGWDVANKQGYAEAYKEVIHEDAVKVGTATKAPDYSFRIGGVRKFFVEAKKPSVSIKDDPSPAFQLRRYAWSAKLPLSILSNFEEFAVYDCRQKPDKTDQASVGRIIYFTADEFEKRWDEIASLFTKEAILKGSFDKFASGARRGKGTAEVDDAFLADIEAWRFVLAKNIASRNPSLSTRQLNFAVQRTIDRLIFLRICEDRGIEDYGRLQGHLNGERVYERLCTVFREADDRYNSGLFHFKDEKERGESPDTVTLNLAIDDKIIREIVSGLYYPESPYEFSVLPADILGQVYEQFLGKVIRLTAGHQAKVEDKPEVRKAGGVFYTPTYIVDYIVKNTVGNLVEGKAPKDAAKLRVLDPACGSGSFLIGAYQFLLDWHRDWYLKNDPAKWTKGKTAALYKTGVGEYRLTTPERKRILLNNIYGVDIDSQAVEVTKLSLLLKVLEGETEQTIAQQLRLFHERALPDLGNNIKCGNSLIGTDFYEGVQESLALYEDEEEKYRINAFDWDGKDGFPEIMRAGGFDAVIGNPPYVRMEEFISLKNYLRKRYQCHDERSDLFAYFIEKEHKLLRPGGRFGMIVSNKFLRSNYGRPLRDFIANNATIENIADFAGLPVFPSATVRTVVLISTTKNKLAHSFKYYSPMPEKVFDALSSGTIDVEHALSGLAHEVQNSSLNGSVWNLGKQENIDLIERFKASSINLSKYCEGQILMGVKSGCTDAFIIDAKTRLSILKKSPSARNIIKPFVGGKDIRRYFIDYKNTFMLYTYHGIDMKKYGGVLEHLEPFRKRLESRATNQKWYELQQPQHNFSEYMDGIKIIFPDIAMGPRFSLDDKGYYSSNTTYFIPKNDLYLLALLNSHLGCFYFAQTCAALEGKNDVYLRFFGQYLEGFPVKIINQKSASEKALHSKLISLVSSMLDLNKKLVSATDDQDKTLYARRIDSTDRQIDKLVYELYGLTEEEIKIVEGEK